MSPKLRVNRFQTLPADHAHCDFVGQSFGMEIWMMGKNPNMAEFMSESCGQFVVRQAIQEFLVDGKQERRLGSGQALHRNHAFVAWSDRYLYVVWHSEPSTEVVHHLAYLGNGMGGI